MRRLFSNTIKVLAVVALIAVAFYVRGKIWNRASSLITISPSEEENSFATTTPISTDSGIISLIKNEIGSKNSLSKNEVIVDTNRERTNQGLMALRENSKLDLAADRKLEDMFSKQYFEHVSPSGIGPGQVADKVGYDYVIVGENLAMGIFKDNASLVSAWMASQGHRENILNTKYTEIGIAVGYGNMKGEKVWIAVQEFGKPLSDCPMVDVALLSSIDRRKTESKSMESQITNLKAQIDALPPTQSSNENYNSLVVQYNDLVNRYNNALENLKIDISAYNKQVNAFNACTK